MADGRVDVTIDIRTGDPFAVLHCRRCGVSQTLMGPPGTVATDVSEFAGTHLDCPPVEWKVVSPWAVGG
jgi:hypothetical protein